MKSIIDCRLGLEKQNIRSLPAAPTKNCIRPSSGGFGLFDQGFLADYYDNAGVGDAEAAFVGFHVVAYFGALGQAYMAVDDGAADARMAADVYVIVDDGLRDF